MLTQPRFAALRLADQVALLVALADGVFDPLPAEVIEGIRERVAAYLDAHAADSVAAIRKTGALDDKTRAALVSVVRDLATQVATGLQQKTSAVMSGKLSEVEDPSERFTSWRR